MYVLEVAGEFCQIGKYRNVFNVCHRKNSYTCSMMINFLVNLVDHAPRFLSTWHSKLKDKVSTTMRKIQANQSNDNKKHFCTLTWSNLWTRCSGLEAALPTFSVGIIEDYHGHFTELCMHFTASKMWFITLLSLPSEHEKIIVISSNPYLSMKVTSAVCVWISCCRQPTCLCLLLGNARKVPRKLLGSHRIKDSSDYPLRVGVMVVAGRTERDWWWACALTSFCGWPTLLKCFWGTFLT